MNIPNILTMSRLIMTVGFVYLFLNGHVVVAALLFVLASVTDFFDGYLARKYNLITSFGKIMDPIADKFLVLSAFGVFSYVHMMPWWMFWVIAIREVGVTLFRFWAMAQGKVLAAEKAGKAKTVLQILAICFMLILFISASDLLNGLGLYQVPVILCVKIAAVVLLWLSVIITLLSGILVVWNNRKLFIKE